MRFPTHSTLIKNTDWSGNPTSRISRRSAFSAQKDQCILRGVFSRGTEVGRSVSLVARQESGPLLPFFYPLLLYFLHDIRRGEASSDERRRVLEPDQPNPPVPYPS